MRQMPRCLLGRLRFVYHVPSLEARGGAGGKTMVIIVRDGNCRRRHQSSIPCQLRQGLSVRVVDVEIRSRRIGRATV